MPDNPVVPEAELERAPRGMAIVGSVVLVVVIAVITAFSFEFSLLGMASYWPKAPVWAIVALAIGSGVCPVWFFATSISRIGKAWE